jgi:hypothetical protein
MKSTRGPRTPMCIDSSTTTPETPTTAVSLDDSIQSPTLSPSMARKRRSESPYRPNHLRPPPRVPQKCFWSSSVQKLSIYHCSPWDFYVPFLVLETWKGMQRTLVLCNHGTEIRVMRTFLPSTTRNETRSTIEVRHRNFIDLYGLYCFEDHLFLVFEYMRFTIEEIVHHAIHLTEPEIAYIVGQVHHPSRPVLDAKLRSQVLNGMRFVSSRGIQPIVISERSIWICPKGVVKIGESFWPK